MGWSDTSVSEAWQDDEEMGESLNLDEDNILSNAILRRGLVFQLDGNTLERNRAFWRQCAVGYLLDKRHFLV